MKQKIYQIDAFAQTVFNGNPAAVCPLTQWFDDATLQKIAEENNLSETAFYVKNNDVYELRWFTPAVEVDLCGHATLAAAHVLFNYEGVTGNSIAFHSPRSGTLPVSRDGQLLTMNFPSDVYTPMDISGQIQASLNKQPVAAFKGKTDIMLVFDSEHDIRAIVPDYAEMEKLEARAIIVTAKGEEADFVSRVFAPAVGIKEDPVTGSAHTTLIPYWAQALQKHTLIAHQLSPRTGILHCTYLNDRVEIGGYATLYLEGEITLR